MMIRRHNFRLAYRSLRAARGRNVLTMLGIIIGVMAVVLVVCIGAGVKRQISGQLGRYGKNVFTVQPYQSAGTTPVTGLTGFTSSVLSENDLHTVQKTAGVDTAVPLTTATGSMTGDYKVTSPFIVATTADLEEIIKQNISYGGFFDSDVDSKTVALGSGIAHKLFSDNAPLGQTLTWRGQKFIVAGVLDNFTAPPFSIEANFNNAVFIPYSTAQTLTGSALGIYEIIGRANSVSGTTATVHNVHAALVKAHGGANDISVQQAANTNGSSDQAIHLLTTFVGGAALVALIVGGIGIMNVMLVSVTERMHEIGLRKAIGATNRQIMRQFMAEAFLLSAGGAVIGVVLSAAAVGLLRLFSNLQPILVWQAMVFAPIIAIAIGLFFGTLPALKAARKDPIEALRHE